MLKNTFKSTIVGDYNKENVLQYIEKLTAEIDVKIAELECEKQALSKFVVETEFNASQKLAEISHRSEETMARAEQQAERLLSQAQEHANQTLTQAQQQASQIILQAELNANKTAEAAQAQKEDILKSCDYAKKFLFRVYAMYQELVDDSMNLLIEKEDENG